MYWPQRDDIKEAFDQDIRNVHLLYNYDAQNLETGEPEKWLYEMWFYNEERIVYAIHGGPMAGRLNYQKADYSMIRKNELWQINWLEETGTICSMVYDLSRKHITTLLGFSKGHWENAEAAHGDKRNQKDFDRWRELAKIGKQTDRFLLHDQADIHEHFRGPGNLQEIKMEWPTL